MGLKVFHHLSMKAGSEDFMVTVAARRVKVFSYSAFLFFPQKTKIFAFVSNRTNPKQPTKQTKKQPKPLTSKPKVTPTCTHTHNNNKTT
jgi:hypothetical protein